jgi:hypothetical protein
MGNLILDYANEFFDQYLDRVGKLLIPFYPASSIAEVREAIPHDLDQNAMKVITTRWPFFTATRRHAIEETESGFPSCNIIKTSFQVFYNSLKGGLYANTEQVASITPGVKVGFKQKYVLRFIIALVTNAWRSIQLLNYGIEIEKNDIHKNKTSA